MADQAHTHPEADKQTAKIVSEIADKAKNHDQDFSGIATEIYNLHRHNPGIFKDEMQRVNNAFHDYAKQNGLQQMDIVGSNGTDLITRSADGKQVQHRDGTNIGRYTEEANDGKAAAHHAQVRPDGSAKYDIQPGDSGWTIAQQRLKDAGVIDDQTDKKTAQNLIGNYVREAGLEHKNLLPGHSIDLPPVQKGGTGTDFGPERQMDQLGKQAKQQESDLATQKKQDLEAAKNIDLALNAAPRDGLDLTLTKQHVQALLSHPEKLRTEEKNALQYVQDNWDHLKDFQKPGAHADMITRNSFNDGGRKRLAAEQTAQQNIDKTYLAMRHLGADL